MPCSDGGQGRYEYDELRRRHQILTVLLCETLRWISQLHPAAVPPPAVVAWWKEHQEEDARRLKSLARQREVSITRLKLQQSQIAEELAQLEALGE